LVSTRCDTELFHETHIENRTKKPETLEHFAA
jgi:hypothetical protein